MYTNDLTYVSSPDSSFSLPVVCAYERWVFNSTSIFKLKGACGLCVLFFCIFFKWKQLPYILCFVSPRPKDWYPLIYDPVFDTYGQGGLVFHVGLMNGGCSLKNQTNHELTVDCLHNSPVTFIFLLLQETSQALLNPLVSLWAPSSPSWPVWRRRPISPCCCFLRNV